MEAICKPDLDIRTKAHDDAVEKLKQVKAGKKGGKDVAVSKVGFHDFYGVWFFGRLREVIRQTSREQFGADPGNAMHVFVDTEPNEISEGVHEITVYGRQCRLYRWKAQGYNRGLVVLADDVPGNRDAEIYRSSGTWSWKLRGDSLNQGANHATDRTEEDITP